MTAINTDENAEISRVARPKSVLRRAAIVIGLLLLILAGAVAYIQNRISKMYTPVLVKEWILPESSSSIEIPTSQFYGRSQFKVLATNLKPGRPPHLIPAKIELTYKGPNPTPLQNIPQTSATIHGQRPLSTEVLDSLRESSKYLYSRYSRRSIPSGATHAILTLANDPPPRYPIKIQLWIIPLKANYLF